MDHNILDPSEIYYFPHLQKIFLHYLFFLFDLLAEDDLPPKSEFNFQRSRQKRNNKKQFVTTVLSACYNNCIMLQLALVNVKLRTEEGT